MGASPDRERRRFRHVRSIADFGMSDSKRLRQFLMWVLPHSLRHRRLSLCVSLFLLGFASQLAADDFSPVTFLDQHCTSCHGPDEPESDLRLDSTILTTEDDASLLWAKIRSKIVEREMPPEDSPQPTESERIQLLAWIEAKYGNPLKDSLAHWSFQPIIRPAVPNQSQTDNPIDAFIERRLQEQGLQFSPVADRRTLVRRLSLDLLGLPPSPDQVRDFVDEPGDTDDAFEKLVDKFLRSPHFGERWAQHWLDVIRWAETVGFETNLERPNAWHYRDWVIRSLNDDMPYDQFVHAQLAGDVTGEDAALGFLTSGPANLPGQIGRDEEAMRQARQDELDEVIKTVSQAFFGLTVGCARCHDHKFDPVTQRDYYAMQAHFAGLHYGSRRLRGKLNDEWTAKVPLVQSQLSKQLDELESRRRELQLRPSLRPIQTESFPPIVADSVRMEIHATETGAASLYEFEIWSVADSTVQRNVALSSNGATASASSFALANQTRHFDNLIDGSVDKRQAFPWVAASGGDAWIQVDFPATGIERVVWHAGSSFPADYEIKVRRAETGDWHTVAHTQNRMPRTSDRRSPESVTLEGVSAEQIQSLFGLLSRIRNTQSELSRLSNGPQVFAATFTETPEPTFLLRRGDPMRRSDKVAPNPPAFLTESNGNPSPPREVDRRLALARHLTSPHHPLASRVIVNRIWHHHFGAGLVETPSDFGKMGALPSHPQLLDWLAREFMENGWSLKKLHRLIVTSRTYKQSSRPNAKALAIDADARLLWRFPPRRLDAEAIRDSILFVSGKLNLQMYGRGFDFFNQRGGLSDYQAKETFDESGWRRMIYAHKIRMESVDIFGAFDCPDAGQMTPRRNQSITPLQALGLLNSSFTNRQAQFFAERLQAESPSSKVSELVHRAFELCLARPPSPKECERLTDLAMIDGFDQVCRILMNTSEFLYLH